MTVETLQFSSCCRVRRSVQRQKAALDAAERFAVTRSRPQSATETIYCIKEEPTSSKTDWPFRSNQIRRHPFSPFSTGIADGLE
jgi:hypothetical protein